MRIRSLQRDLRSLEKLILRRNDSRFTVEMDIIVNTLMNLDNIETYHQLEELSTRRIPPTVRSEISTRVSNVVTVYQDLDISAHEVTKESKNIVKNNWWGKIYNWARGYKER